MALRFAELMFTPRVKAEQERLGSRAGYARVERPEAPARDRLGPAEAAFVAARDSAFLATVSETGWPYVQHRGGAPGFLRVLDERTIGFAELSGNRQYVSLGNLAANDRVAMILVDYPNRRRLKIAGRARAVEPGDDAALLRQLVVPGTEAKVERGILIAVEALDWNCPKYITPRYSEQEMAPLLARLAEAEAERDRLRETLGMRVEA